MRQDKCVGNKLCNKACPYGVVTYSEQTRTSHKCTLCNDRIHNGLGTACAKACPTGSILFGDVPELKAKADARLAKLRALGEARANLYGYREAGGLKVFYLLRDDPAVYGLPLKPVVPKRRKFGLLPKGFHGVPFRLTALATGIAALIGFRERGSR